MNIWWRHFAYWFCILLLWTYLKSYGSMNTVYFFSNSITVALFMALYYGLKNIQIPKFYNQNKPWQFVLSILIASAIYLIFWSTGMKILDIGCGEKFVFPNLHWKEYLHEAIQAYSPVVALLAWESHREGKIEQEEIERLENEKIENELNFLKTQLNPKFLFKTLKTLHIKIKNESSQAPEMIMKLSEILDYSLYKSQNKQVSIKEEIKTIENFISLEKIRHDSSLEIEFTHHDLISQQVSPLVLLSFLEFAFNLIPIHHSAVKKISIVIKGINNTIESAFKIEGLKIPQLINDRKSELIKLKRQLNISYPHSHTLQVDEQSDSYKTTLQLELPHD